MYKKLNIVNFPILFYFALGGIAIADDIDAALQAAYESGYRDGYQAGSGGGGGSDGMEIGFRISPQSGGGTSGYEVPWAIRHDNINNTLNLLKYSGDTGLETININSSREMLKLFKPYNKGTGVVVIDSMPIKEMERLEGLLKRANVQNFWIAPSLD